jgi:uncharacterized membrane protein
LLIEILNPLQYQKMRDLTKQMEEKKNKNSGNGIALGACFGLVFGSAFGIVFEDISTGVALGAGFGLSIGVAFGAIFDFAKNRA